MFLPTFIVDEYIIDVTPDNLSRTFFSPWIRVAPEFTISNGICKNSYCQSGVTNTVLYPLEQPVSASILWPNQSWTGISCHRVDGTGLQPSSWVLSLLPKVNTHLIRTIFHLNHGDGRHVMQC